jgi:hypothetical protein
MTQLCAHPGCIRRLSAGNASGVCRDHMHGPACACAGCRANPTPAQRRFAFAHAVDCQPGLDLPTTPRTP